MTDNPSRTILIVQPGPMTLVQDRGRFGFQQLGVSVSGAVDIDALDTANLLVGNDPNAACLEVMLGGLEIEFPNAIVIAVTGAESDVTIDGVPISLGVSYFVHAGARLELGMAINGLRTYIAVAGGIEIAQTLGSRSTHLASGIGGVDGRALVAGDVIDLGEPSDAVASGLLLEDDSQTLPGSEINVRIVLGPQDDEFSGNGIASLFNSTYTVSDQSNRQGLRLDGPVIESKSGRYDIVSDAVVNGSIQVPGDGKPIILLADRQTTGGYAKIATVATVDLPRLGQAGPGTKITFSAITVEESQELLAARSERFKPENLASIVEQISLKVDGDDIVVGVADNGSSTLAAVERNTYPVSVEEYTPAG
ncbi:MAG: biotin-dependent carboxyltransferase [Chloroflexi bacterium]|jgi:antagonist of KipI|nr:biotin-dependent carboxyltransferase [Chloroflexota bacterium]